MLLLLVLGCSLSTPGVGTRLPWLPLSAFGTPPAGDFFPAGDGAYVADLSPSLRLRLGPSGASVLAAVDGGVLSLATAAIGRETRASLPAEGPVSCTESDCVRLLGDAEESWIRRAGGLEQTLRVALPPAGSGPLMWEIRVSDAVASGTSGDGGWLSDASGRIWDIAAPAAWDADGRLLPATLEVGTSRVRVRVDDEGARYPIVVDPVYTTPSWTLTGEYADGLGSDIAGAGDVNGDGYADVIVGVRGTDGGHGSVWIFHGGPGGLASSPDTEWSGAEGEFLGVGVAGVGDVNGDGYADIACAGFGVVYVHHGGAGGVDPVPSDVLPGEFLSYMAGLGDVNGDGFGDLAVYEQFRGESEVSIWFGGAGGLGEDATGLAITDAPDTAGGHSHWVTGAGDVDGDGFADVAYGAPRLSSAGTATVAYGSADGIDTGRTLTLTGEPGDCFGFVVAGGSDVDGDGFPDLLVTTPCADGHAGGAVVYPGAAGGLVETPWVVAGGGALEGATAVGLGDVDADGYGDIALGAPGDGVKAVRVYRGSAAGPVSPGLEVPDVGHGLFFAIVIAGPGDVNGDGFDDLLVTDWTADGRGEVYLYLGTDVIDTGTTDTDSADTGTTDTDSTETDSAGTDSAHTDSGHSGGTDSDTADPGADSSPNSTPSPGGGCAGGPDKGDGGGGCAAVPRWGSAWLVGIAALVAGRRVNRRS
jgi:hypothetical protein